MKKLLINLAIAAAIALVLIFGSMLYLNIATMHGKELAVPDFTNMSMAEAQQLAAESQVRLDVVDSVYVKGMSRGHVYKQNPLPGAQVKKGRRILITINAINSKKTTVPNLVGYSTRQAISELQSRSLALGRLIYRNDMATDNVLGQRYKDQPVAAGTKLEVGSAIDLVVGLSANDCNTRVPSVVGMRSLTAVDAVHTNSLNVKLVYDSSVRDYNDTIKAVVYSQSPSAEIIARKGHNVTMFLTMDPEKLSKTE